MIKRIGPCVPAALVVVAVAGTAAMSYSRAAHAIDSCVTEPDLQSTEPGHWYYRIDPANHRKCWFLGPESPVVRQATAAKPALPPVPLPRRAPNAPMTPATEIAATQATAAAAQSVDAPKPADSIQPLAATDRSESDDRQADQTASDTMPLVWPVLTPAELAAAAQSSEVPTDSAQIEPMSKPLIVALALAATAIVAGCTLLTYFILQRRARRNLSKLRRRHSLRGYPIERDILTAAAQALTATASKLDERHQTAEPVDGPQAIEETLEQLARAWERSAA